MQRPSRTAFALTPDSRQLVYHGLASSGKTQFYLRRLDRVDAAAISGTEGGLWPFLSPDGKWVAGFFSDGKMKKVPIEGGTPVTICEFPAVPFGASWGTKDVIVYSCQGRLWKVSASGGEPEAITTPSSEKGELINVLPCFLPGGDSLLFSTQISPDRWDNPRTEVLSLRTGGRKVLLEEGADARYLSTGHLIFAKRGSLCAVPLDIDRLEVTGEPVAVVEDIMQAMNATNSEINSFAAQFSVSASGALAYVTGGAYPDPADLLDWIDREGSAHPLITTPGPYFSPRISPDGTRVAYATIGRQRNIWVYDVERGARTQLTFGGMNRWPLWTPDGTKVTYVSWDKTLRAKIFKIPFDGGGQAELLLEGADLHPASWSLDGKSLALVQGTVRAGFDILVFHPEDGEIEPFLKTPFNEEWPAFSPDGRWIAYASDETKRWEVYVRPYPGPGAKITISTEGAFAPAWHPDGSELYFVSLTVHRVMGVDVSTRPSLVVGKPRVLFDAIQYGTGAYPVRGYDTDGKRFVAFERKEGLEAPPVTQIDIVLNWFEELKRLVPPGK